MKLAVFGSTGRTGRILVDKAHARGHEVTAFLRQRKTGVWRREPALVVQGDVLSPEAVERAVEGADAVVSALGVGMGSRRPVLSGGIRNIVDAMKRFAVPRLICLSSYGSGDSYPDARVTLRLFFSLPHLGPRYAYEDKRIQDGIIRDSGLEWVVVRPTRFVTGPERGAFRVGEHLRLGLFSSISRADVAEFMLDQLASDEWLYRFPQLSD